MVLVLGEEYGVVQTGTGLSATHEEYREAKGRKPVIAFVQQAISPGPAQSDFIAEVQGWEEGLFRGTFGTPAELQAGVIRALHDYELANAVAPEDPSALIARAGSLLPPEPGNSSFSGEPMLSIAVVGGPSQRILRPVQIEARELREHLHQAGLFGDSRIFSGTKGVTGAIQNGALILQQERGTLLQLDEEGSVLIRLPLVERMGKSGGWSGFPALIEEVVQERIATAISYAGMAFEHIDPTQRLTHVAIAARIDGGDHMGWRTQAEQSASPNSGSISMGFGVERSIVDLSQPRAALRLNTGSIVEDLIVPLRRQWKTH